MTTNKLKAVGYCRFLRGEKSNIYSIEEQTEAIKEYASESNYSILKIFTDKNVSGRRFERQGLKELINYINLNYSDIDLLIVSDTTRIFIKQNNLWWAFRRLISNNRVDLKSLVYYIPKYIQKQAE
jgi:hypothetical protein